MPEPFSNSKEISRADAKARRHAIVPGGQADAVVPRFIGALKPKAGTIVALYRARDDEINPAPLAGALSARGVLCAYPVVTPAMRLMRFALWREGMPLIRGPFGIEQPTDEALTAIPNIVVLPLLAWDRMGTRLGYGGGYYDATLAVLRERRPVLAVGLAFDEQESEAPIPVEPHDIPLDWIVTPSGARFW